MSDCIEWTGAKLKGGYGIRNYEGKTVTVHRLAWELEYGPIPPGMFVCHKCDNRACYNVEHLYLGDHLTNMADMVAKGRHVHGERHHKAKLTETVVRALRDGTMTVQQVADEFGVSTAAARMAKRGDTWASV